MKVGVRRMRDEGRDAFTSIYQHLSASTIIYQHLPASISFYQYLSASIPRIPPTGNFGRDTQGPFSVPVVRSDDPGVD